MMLVEPAATPQSILGSTAGSVPINPVPSTPQSGTAAANTAVTVTITGFVSTSLRITSLSVSYSAAPTGGSVTIVVNSVTIFQGAVTSAGFTSIPLPAGGLECQSGQNAVVTLTAGGSSVIGTVNVSSYLGS